MTVAAVTALVIGIGSFFGGFAALLTARSTNNKNKVEGKTIGEASLANAVKVVEEVYDKVTVRLNAQIDELLEDNQILRKDLSDNKQETKLLREEIETVKDNERKCRSEVALLRLEVEEARAEKR